MEGTRYTSARSLGIALGSNDGSLVTKWLNGGVLEVKSASHRKKLPRLLNTPADYFSDAPRSDRLAKLEVEAGALRGMVLSLATVARELVAAVQELGGSVPDAAIEELAQAVRHMQSGARPS